MKIQSYQNFRQRIHKSAKKNSFPLRVMFELTYRCNFNCKHCYVPRGYRRGKRELRTKEIFSILDQLKDIGCFYLGFTGGEPFIREDIMDILCYAKKKGFALIIYTNGSLINEKIVTKLANLWPNKIDITIPAMSEYAFGRITQVAGAHKRVFKTIDLLHKKGISLGFKSCLLKENENEIEDIKRFVSSLGAFYRLDDMLMPRLDGSREPYEYKGSSKEDLAINKREFLESDLEKCNWKTGEREPAAEGLFRCDAGKAQAAITPLGELKMCLMIDYPKYKLSTAGREHKSEDRRKGASLKDAWNKLKELVSNIKADQYYKCTNCELKDFCKWCPAKSRLYNGTFTSCEPESRKYAEAKRQKYEALRISSNRQQQ